MVGVERCAGASRGDHRLHLVRGRGRGRVGVRVIVMVRVRFMARVRV